MAFTYSSGTTADGYYSLTSSGSGKVVDLYQSSAADGTLIEQWTLGTGNNQRWFIEQTSDGKYRMVSRSSGDAISVPTVTQTPVPSVTRTNGGADVQLAFPSQFGWAYTVLGSLDLRNWTALGTPLAGTGQTLTYTQAGAGTDPGHYWKLSIRQALNSWTWNNLSTQKWSFSAP